MSPTSKLRLCLMTESFHPIIGGGESHARLIAAELTRRGAQVAVVTRCRVPKTPRHETLDGFNVHRVRPNGFDRLGKYLMIPGALLKLFTLRKEYDAIYVCGIRTLGVVGVLAGRLLRKPCVLRIESCTEMSGDYALGAYIDDGQKKRRGLSAYAIRVALSLRNAILRRADRFLAISRVIQDEFEHCGVTPSRISRIPNGIDLTRFEPASDTQKQTLRRSLDLPEAQYLAVYTGKLNHGKGLDTLLRSWLTLCRDHPNIHLILVGSGANQSLSCEKALRDFVNHHQLNDRVTFTGQTHDVAGYLRACDLFVFPSQSEALGISLIEALACRLPSIATATGGILDIMEHDVSGRLIPVDDEQALTDAIRWMIDHPARAAALAEAGWRIVESRYGIEQVAAAHERLFNESFQPENND